MKNNLIVTWLSGETASSKEASVFFNSLDKLNYQGDKIVFTDNLSSEFRTKIEALNWKVVDVVSPSEQIEDPVQAYYFLLQNRWFVYGNYLNSVGIPLYDNVVITDSRDVLFQNLDFLDKSYDKVQLICEGMRHFQCAWNQGDQLALQFHLPERLNFMDWPVLNGGFQVGNYLRMRDLCSTMSLSCMMTWPKDTPCCHTDQAVLNLMYNPFGQNSSVIVHPQDNTLCLTGEAVKRGFVKIGVDCKSYTDYSVFHQWDRTEFKDEIIDKYAWKE
jgi:hypothetical protein